MQKRVKALLSLAIVPAVMLVTGYFSIALASLVPGEYRPNTDVLPDFLEHALAYFVIGFLTALIVPSRYASPLQIAAGLSAFSGMLELVQIYIPHRVCAFDDFAAGTIGGTIGVCLVAAFLPQRRLA